MKSIFGLIGLFAVVFAMQARAENSYISCSNGTIDQVGDALFQVNLLEDGIEFLPYEGSFTIDAEDTVYDTGTFAVISQLVTKTSEGEESQTVVNAMLTFESSTTMHMAIGFDDGEFETYKMTCVSK